MKFRNYINPPSNCSTLYPSPAALTHFSPVLVTLYLIYPTNQPTSQNNQHIIAAMNPTLVRAFHRSSIRMSQAAVDASSHGMPASKWFATMLGVGLLLGSGAIGLQKAYSNSKIDQIFHKERRQGQLHN